MVGKTKKRRFPETKWQGIEGSDGELEANLQLLPLCVRPRASIEARMRITHMHNTNKALIDTPRPSWKRCPRYIWFTGTFRASSSSFFPRNSKTCCVIYWLTNFHLVCRVRLRHRAQLREFNRAGHTYTFSFPSFVLSIFNFFSGFY